MGKIIMTGVDGNFGGHAARTILEKVDRKDLIFTSPNKAVVEKYVAEGIDARYADYTDPAQLLGAFAGGETLLLISVPQVGEKRRRMHKNAIDAAVKAGVKRLVYTSIVGAGVKENDAYEIADHKYTEAYILGTGLKYVILRDAQYCEAMVAAFMQAADSGGVLTNNMGEGRMAHVARNDCAEAAACAAAGAGGDNVVYYITGPTANTMEEFVAIGSAVTGRKVVYQYITDEEMWAFFDSKFVPRKTDGDWSRADPAFPFCSDGMVTFGRAIRLDQMSNCTGDFELLTGKKPKSVREVFEDIENYQIGRRTATD
jgi:NAD(P)H dehydrogenase (quinone)